jgi:hypothetical protein
LVQGQLSLTPLLLRNREGPVRDCLSFSYQRKLVKVLSRKPTWILAAIPQKQIRYVYVDFIVFMIFLLGSILYVMEEEEGQGRKRVKIKAHKELRRKERLGKLLTSQEVTPDVHNNTTRGYDGTLVVE